MSRSSKDTESSSTTCITFETVSTSRRQTDRKSFISPKQIIHEAVEALELEATKWRNASDRITSEVEALRLENDHLRQQLETTKEERDAANRQIKALDEANRKLEAEKRRCIDELEKESRKANELEEALRRRTAEEGEELHRLKDALNRKAADLKAVHKEQEAIQVRLAKATKENLDDRSFELMHEVESLKRELQTLRASKDDVSRTNLNLLAEIKNTETLLSDRELRLRNETMRHSLLTTQFNSLMEENAALKEKQHVKAMVCRYNSDRDVGGGGASSTAAPTSPVVISIEDTNRLQMSSTLPLKTSVSGIIIPDRSLSNATSLCRHSSFSTGRSNREGGTGEGGGGGYGDGNWKRDSIHRLSLSRGRSCVDKKRISGASSDGSTIPRQIQTIPDLLQVPTNSDDSVSSTSSRTLPLLVSSSTSGKKWKP